MDEANARVELAGFYRLVEHMGWGDGVYNHIALRVPGEPDKSLSSRTPLLMRK